MADNSVQYVRWWESSFLPQPVHAVIGIIMRVVNVEAEVVHSVIHGLCTGEREVSTGYPQNMWITVDEVFGASRLQPLPSFRMSSESAPGVFRNRIVRPVR